MHDLLIFTNAPGIFASEARHLELLRLKDEVPRPPEMRRSHQPNSREENLHMASHPESMPRKCEPYTPSSMPRKCVEGDLSCMHDSKDIPCMQCNLYNYHAIIDKRMRKSEGKFYLQLAFYSFS